MRLETTEPNGWLYIPDLVELAMAIPEGNGLDGPSDDNLPYRYLEQLSYELLHAHVRQKWSNKGGYWFWEHVLPSHRAVVALATIIRAQAEMELEGTSRVILGLPENQDHWVIQTLFPNGKLPRNRAEDHQFPDEDLEQLGITPAMSALGSRGAWRTCRESSSD